MTSPAEPTAPLDETARIPARTERLALDWSLVLASQGIAVVIENDPEAGWGLRVPAAEHARARRSLELYRRENRRWPWQRTVLKQEFLFDWAASLWVLLTCVAFWFQRIHPRVRETGIMDSAAVAGGEWWRLFTAEVLHADSLHLATNAVFGLILLGLALGRFGTGVGLLAAYLAGAAGNVCSWLVFGEPHRSLGASGVVMGALGMLAAQSVGAIRHDRRGWKIALGGLAGGGMLFVLLGLSPGTDIAAHFGGFVAGAVFGAVLVSVQRLPRATAVNLMAGLIFVLLVVWPWTLALKTAP